MVGEAPESGEGEAPDSPSAAVRPQSTGTNDGAPPAPGHVHAHHSPMHFRFFQQLKHRNVIRVGILYLVVCWLILDPVHVLFHMLEVPVWANRLVVILMAIGFPAVLLFGWVYEMTPEGLKPAAEVDPQGSIRHQTGQRLNRAIFVVLVLAVAYLLADKLWLSKHPTTALPVTTVAPGAPAVTSAATAISERSVAVLPFVDMSEKKDQEYFSDGLSEELIDMLTKVPELRVPARTSSFYFKGKQATIADIAKVLAVAHVLEGSVRKSGNTLRITAQLIRVDNGYHLWSETYDRKEDDIFKVQDEIAGAVVTALKVRLLPTQQPSAQGEQHTENLEAYNLYLQGRQNYNQGDAAGYQRAVTAFRAAIALDPHYAAAYAHLALAQFWLTNDSNTDDSDTIDIPGWDSALADAEQAVALAPELAAGYSARGFVRAAYRFDFAGAQVDHDKAVALSPRDADVLHRSAILLAVLGKLPAAIAREEQALALDPLSAEICMRLGFFLVADQQLVRARTLYARAIAIAPNSFRAHVQLGNLELLEHQPERALVIFRQKTGFSLGGQAKAEYSLGHADASERILKQLIANKAYAPIADVYAWRGEKDQAFQWLERAYEVRDAGLTWIKIDNDFRSLRDDPRYKALLRKMNLPE